MSTTKIIFMQTFPTGQYANQKLAIETEINNDSLPINQTARERTIKEMFEKNKKLVEEAFVAMNPQINWAENNLPEITKSYIPTDFKLEERKVDYSLGITVDDINSCQDKSTLESYRLLVKNKPELEAAFLSKLKEFI